MGFWGHKRPARTFPNAAFDRNQPPAGKPKVTTTGFRGPPQAATLRIRIPVGPPLAVSRDRRRRPELKIAVNINDRSEPILAFCRRNRHVASTPELEGRPSRRPLSSREETNNLPAMPSVVIAAGHVANAGRWILGTGSRSDALTSRRCSPNFINSAGFKPSFRDSILFEPSLALRRRRAQSRSHLY